MVSKHYLTDQEILAVDRALQALEKVLASRGKESAWVTYDKLSIVQSFFRREILKSCVKF